MKKSATWPVLLACVLSLSLVSVAPSQSVLGKKGAPQNNNGAPQKAPQSKPQQGKPERTNPQQGKPVRETPPPRTNPQQGKPEQNNPPRVSPQQGKPEPPSRPRTNPIEKPRPGRQEEAPRANNGGQDRGEAPALGRPDRNTERPSLGKREDNNNIRAFDNRIAERGQVKPLVISDVPVISNNRSIIVDADREDRARVNRGRNYDNRYRHNYYQYSGSWCNDDFRYRHYGYYYDPVLYVPSPFYYYSNLPGYVSCSRIQFGVFSWTSCTTRYPWRSDRYRDNYDRDRILEASAESIEHAFQRGNVRFVEDLIPNRGTILVDVDGSGRYRIDGDEFYTMFVDLVEGTRTIDYNVTDVYRDRDEATIVARHTFYTGWGERQSMRHTFGLQRDRGGYAISYFKSSRY
ncbi:MAG: hypothetical protein KIT11_11735 [Fimbriimonadaceae bacterium]|nr:hypothetical protein [Fimbriimonadaceae bacterium]QYK55295.1 MAG: hypothetical protein KF733_09800 [Fimbriimonadaceae bacterium]